MSVSPALYAETVSNLCGNFIQSRSACYELDNFLLVKTITPAFSMGEGGVLQLCWHDLYILCQLDPSTTEIEFLTAKEKMSALCIPPAKGKMIFMGQMPKSLRQGETICYYACRGSTSTVRMHMDIDIRPLIAQDLDLIAGLGENDNGEFAHIAQQLYHDADALNHTHEQMTDIRLLGAFADERLVGGVAVRAFTHTDDVRFVSNIYVDPAYRRRSIGGSLLRSALALFPNVMYVYALLTHNLPSCHTALSCGFTLAGETNTIL